MHSIDILFIEDNPHDAEMALSVLKEHKVTQKILVLKDGAAALDFLFGPEASAEQRQSPFPKLILLDLKLPKVNGLEILKKIKSAERTRSIPVIILSSSNEERDRIECYAHGANSYIVKPVDFEHFSRAIVEIGHYWIKLNRPYY